MDKTLRFDTSESAIDRDEASLVASAQNDPLAFAEIYRRYLPRIYSYLQARAGTGEEADDLTEQVFLRAFRALPRYRDRGVPFAAWLFKIARNVVTDAHRRHRATVSWEQLPVTVHPIDTEDPETEVIRREEIHQLRTLIAELPVQKQEIVTLRFIAGLKLHEIAQVVGKSESTVHYQLNMALRNLKERLDEER